MEDIIIIGNGIAGVTAARHIRKNSSRRITLISSESEHFFSRTALMYVYMGHMTFDQIIPYESWFWEKNSLNLVQGHVSKVAPDKKELILQDGQTLKYETLIIATGSKPNRFNWPGQDLPGVQGLYSRQDLELLEANAPNKKVCRRAVIVGGGLIGIELAEMLRSRDIPVTFLVREKNFWDGVLPDGDAKMLNEHIREHHIDLRLETSLKEILADDHGKVKAVITENDETIACDLVGLTPGVTPNIDFLKGSGIELGKGVKVNKYLETNIQGVYAIGDCAEQQEPVGLRKPVEAVWYTGRMMGETVAQTLCGNRIPYKPGHWFNSAKFLDIEYQTYGWVFSTAAKKEHESHFHWRHPEDKICLTLAFHQETRQFLGLNTFGIRMRHEMIDRWLTEKRDIFYVMEFLTDANFDPEFYTSHEPAIVRAFNEAFNTQIRGRKKSWKRIFTQAPL